MVAPAVAVPHTPGALVNAVTDKAALAGGETCGCLIMRRSDGYGRQRVLRE